MQAKVPVLASPIPPHAEVLAECTECLLDADEDRWPAQLIRFLDAPSLRATVAERCLRRVENDYSPAAQDVAYARLYRALCETTV
jgi:glycosyltransferase involved in cell wall biosynthesis